MGIAEKLMRIQTEIKAPKNLYNSFGKYNYRNAEGICEAVKPYLKNEGCSLVLSDEITEIGGRIYVKAIAALQDIETTESVKVSAFAREASEKKGMDDSQITGTASSYARKYALNGLFLLDDTKDADSDEYANQANSQKPEPKKQAEAKKPEKKQATEEEKDAEETEKIAKEKIGAVHAKALEARCKNEGVPVDLICKLYKVDALTSLTNAMYRNIADHWNQILEQVKK